METPLSSSRRVTRSQALSAMSNNSNLPISKKGEDSETTMSKSRQRNRDRSAALIDITNDSPIVGLAMGSLETPLSAIAKQRSSRAKKTPGSGEALLRGQVKTLLQKVEEEAELSKLSLESRRPFLHLKGVVNSPSGLLAPTPANTPQVSNLSGDGSMGESVTPSQIVKEQLISQVINDLFDGKNQESVESEKSQITRSLLLDFSEKSENSCDASICSSVVTFQGESESKDKTTSPDDDGSSEVTFQGESESKDKTTSPDDDDSSTWSIQANASTHDEDDEEVVEGGEERDDVYEIDEEEEEEEEEDEGGLVEELCEGISRISVKATEFEGKHTRFVYDSDDELIVCAEVSPSVMRLKGLPTPKGKHMRFSLEDDDEE